MTAMTQSPSPSFLKSLGYLAAFVIFPVLALIWATRSHKAEKSEWIPFLLFAFAGVAEIVGIFLGRGATFLWLQVSTWSLIAYFATLFLHLLFLAMVKDEFAKKSA